VERAARYEICRQASVLQSGGIIRQETRHFDELTGTTSSGRAKETAEDYRYFPEPDLVPVAPSAAWVARVRASLPELPWVRRERLQREWAFTDLEMRDVVNAGGVDLVAATVEAGAAPGDARSWWMSYLAQQANTAGIELSDLAITPAQVAAVIAMVSDGSLTTKLARQVVDGVLAGEGEPSQIVEARGLAVVSDDAALQAAIDTALAAQPDVADKIRSGRVQAIGAIVGAVMKATRGQADAGKVRELTLATLGVSAS
jgi:aspartyl-tRNA(Asn)/glutamyl-tRNA(Gln) amidotransferase subunit B